MSDDDDELSAFYAGPNRPSDYSKERIVASLRRYMATGGEIPKFFLKGWRARRDATEARYFKDERLQQQRDAQFDKKHPSPGKPKYFVIPPKEGD